MFKYNTRQKDFDLKTMNRDSPKNAPASCAIAEGDIHVWRLNLIPEGHAGHALEGFLSEDERCRAARFHSATDRRRFLMRRGACRQILARYLEVHPHALHLAPGPHGKPEIQDQSAAGPLHFNWSQSADRGLLVVAPGCRVGVDMEHHRPLPEAMPLARAFFSPAEVAALERLPEAVQQAAFFDCWTRKEAFVKALGAGLSFPLNRFTVSVGPEEPARLVEVDGNPAEADRWSMMSLDLGGDWSASLVSEGPWAQVFFYDWQASTSLA